jgi:hypothetical protein
LIFRGKTEHFSISFSEDIRQHASTPERALSYEPIYITFFSTVTFENLQKKWLICFVHVLLKSTGHFVKQQCTAHGAKASLKLRIPLQMD